MKFIKKALIAAPLAISAISPVIALSSCSNNAEYTASWSNSCIQTERFQMVKNAIYTINVNMTSVPSTQTKILNKFVLVHGSSRDTELKYGTKTCYDWVLYKNGKRIYYTEDFTIDTYTDATSQTCQYVRLLKTPAKSDKYVIKITSTVEYYTAQFKMFDTL